MWSSDHEKPVIAIVDQAAICSAGLTWGTIWNALLASDRSVFDASKLDLDLSFSVDVCALPELDRSVKRHPIGFAAGARLAEASLSQMDLSGCGALYGSSNHGESDALLEYASGIEGNQNSDKLTALHHSLDQDPILFETKDDLPSGASRIWTYSACASSLYAVALATLSLRSGQSDQSVAVLGVDALSVLAINGFRRIGALTKSGARPFHTARDGLLIGEGSAALVLRSKAKSQPGDITITGFGLSCDAGHTTSPNNDGTFLNAAILCALEQAGLSPDNIDAIIAHGTGTEANDGVEANVIQSVFGARSIPVTSLKGTIGHCMGAAGILNVLAARSALEECRLPPTWTDGGTIIKDIDLVLDAPRSIPSIRHILVLSAGFGGTNAALVVSKDS